MANRVLHDNKRPPSSLPPDAADARLTRRRLLVGAAGATVLGAGALGASLLLRDEDTPSRARRAVHPATAPRAPHASFRTRPDLEPPVIRLSGHPTGAASLLVGPGSEAQLSQQGPLIVDSAGEVVWFRPLPKGSWATNVATVRYRGARALSWWEGKIIAPGYGQGEAVIVDTAYRELARVRAGNGALMDMHELQITPEGTALFFCYPRVVAADLSPEGGPAKGRVLESVFQELDLRSGRVLLEWRSLDHIPLADSYKPPADPWDYVHLNSIRVAPDGNLLVSARHTWAVYKLDRRTGQVMWRLGGKRSDFAMGPHAAFSWQHDARAAGGSQITLFDDGSDGPQRTASESRGIVLDVDAAGRTARLAREYRHPQRLLASAMGSFELLAGGGAPVGWGTAARVSEFAPNGSLVADARLPPKLYTYRASRDRGARTVWRGLPDRRPDVAVRRGTADAGATLYVSWNGATEVTRWRVHRGSGPRRLSATETAPRRGFETAISLSGGGGYAAVAALDRAGRELGRTHVVRV